MLNTQISACLNDCITHAVVCVLQQLLGLAEQQRDVMKQLAFSKHSHPTNKMYSHTSQHSSSTVSFTRLCCVLQQLVGSAELQDDVV